jgi:hypothetical protein
MRVLLQPRPKLRSVRFQHRRPALARLAIMEFKPSGSSDRRAPERGCHTHPVIFSDFMDAHLWISAPQRRPCGCMILQADQHDPEGRFASSRRLS